MIPQRGPALAARDTGWRWWYLLAGYAGVLGAGMLPALLGGVALEGEGGVLLSFVNMLALGALPLMLVIALARRRPTRCELGFVFDNLPRQALVALAAVVALNLAYGVMDALFPGRFGGVDAAEIRASGFGAGLGADLLTLMSVAVLAPLSEELAFRVAIFRPLYDGLRNWRPTVRAIFSVAVAALIFTLPHAGPGDTSFVLYLMVAALFPLVYLLTGSLVAAMLAHAFQSTYAWGMLLYSARSEVVFSPALYAAVAAAPLVVLALAWLVSRVFPRDARA